MKYFKCYREAGAKPIEITEDEAKKTLTGFWHPGFLENIFSNKKSFSLYTPFAEVWTEDDKGLAR